MNCITTLEELPSKLSILYKNTPTTVKGLVSSISKLRDKVAANAELSTYFESNPNSTTKLHERMDTIDTSAVHRQIEHSIQLFVKTLVFNKDYDNFLINPWFDASKDIREGWQSTLGMVTTKDVNGNTTLKPEVLKALSISATDWLANTALPDRGSTRSDDAIRSMFGLDKKAPINEDMRKEAAKVDAMYNASANFIGNNAYKLLGLKAKSPTENVNTKQIEAKLKLELGMVVIQSLVHNQYMRNIDVELDVANPKSKKKTIVKGIEFREDITEYLNPDKKDADYMYTDTVNEDKKHGVFTVLTLAVPTDEEIVNEGVSGMLGNVVSTDHKEAVKIQSATANNFKVGYNNVIQYMDKIGVLKPILGAKDESKVIAIRRPSVIGKNNAINDNIRYLLEAFEEFGTNTPMYARWKAITNNRFMIDSNKLNWQDKKLHRFAVYNSIVRLTPENENVFLLALGQSLGVDVDKHTATRLLLGTDNMISKELASIRESMPAIMDEVIDKYSTVEEFEASTDFATIVSELVESKFEDKGSISEAEHYISGIVELVKYDFYKTSKLLGNNDIEFHTPITLETDAITSGYGIKNVQFPLLFGNITDQLRELEKVGIFTSKDDSYGTRKDNNVLDSYEEPARELADNVIKHNVKVPEVVMKLIDPKASYTTDSNGNRKFVTTSRAFMKDPFMVLNYGSGISSILSGILKNTENTLYGKIDAYYEAYNGGKDSKSKAPELLKELENIEKALGSNFTSQLKTEAFTKEGVFELDKKTTTSLRDLISTTQAYHSTGDVTSFGDALALTLEVKYGKYIELTKAINETFTFQFRVAKEVLDRRIKSLYESRIDAIVGDNNIPARRIQAARLVASVTEKEITTMVQELADVFPVLNSVLKTEDGKFSQLLVAKKRRASGKEGDVEILGNVAASGYVRAKSIKTNKNTNYVNGTPDIYKLVEAYSSGAVVPIHFFDGSVQAKVLQKFKALGVHDANFFNIDDAVNGTSIYNEEWINLNKGYHLMHEIMQSMVKTLMYDDYNEGELADIISNLDNAYSEKDKDGIIKEYYSVSMQKFAKKLHTAEITAEENRAKIFSNDLYVEHAYMETLDTDGNTVSAMYHYKPSAYATKITGEATIKEAISKLKPSKVVVQPKADNLKATDSYLPEVHISENERLKIDKLNAMYIKKYGIKVKFGDEFMYEPTTNTIRIVPDTTAAYKTVYLAHEIKHALTYQWLVDNKDSRQYKYLVEAIEAIEDKHIDVSTGAGYELAERIGYIRSKDDVLIKVSELVAILSAEPNIREEFIKQFPQKKASYLKRIFTKILSMLGKIGKIDTSYVVQIVDEVIVSGEKSKQEVSEKTYPDISKLINQPDIKGKRLQEDAIRKRIESHAFDINPELSKIGTKEEYDTYIDTVFPDSLSQDLYTHVTSNSYNTELFEKEVTKALKLDELYTTEDYTPDDIDVMLRFAADDISTALADVVFKGFDGKKTIKLYDGKVVHIDESNQEELKKIYYRSFYHSGRRSDAFKWDADFDKAHVGSSEGAYYGYGFYFYLPRKFSDSEVYGLSNKDNLRYITYSNLEGNVVMPVKLNLKKVLPKNVYSTYTKAYKKIIEDVDGDVNEILKKVLDKFVASIDKTKYKLPIRTLNGLNDYNALEAANDELGINAVYLPTEVVMIDNDDIHILGSAKDLAMFKEWKKGQNTTLKATNDYLPEVKITATEAKQIDKLNDNYIKKFNIKVKFGNEFNYNPEDNSITIITDYPAKARAVYVAHEIKHAITYQWLKDGTHRDQYKYLVKALSVLKKWKPDSRNANEYLLYDRLQYATNPLLDEFSQVAELVAILTSEPHIRKEFMKYFPQEDVHTLTKILNTIKRMLGKLATIDTSYVIPAVDTIVEDAMNSHIEESVDTSNFNDVTKEELYVGDRVAASASITKATVNSAIHNYKYNGFMLDKKKHYNFILDIHSNIPYKGYAKAIMEHVVNKYANKDLLVEVPNNTSNSNKLIQFYSTYGFELVPNTGSTILMAKLVNNSSSMVNTGIIAIENNINNLC